MPDNIQIQVQVEQNNSLSWIESESKLDKIGQTPNPSWIESESKLDELQVQVKWNASPS
jgi:hypothetical protein